jgi:hypothetical protein
VIGAHAMHAWIEPRLTADIDVTAQLALDDLGRLEAVFAEGEEGPASEAPMRDRVP